MSTHPTPPFANPFAPFMPEAMRQWAQLAPAGAPAGWVTPTLSTQDLDKRIEELKVVQFWLEQNARMIAATVQALEVQKMTLSALQALNVGSKDLAKALQVQPQDLMRSWASATQTGAPAQTPPQASAQADQEPLPSEEPFDAPPDAAPAPPPNQAGLDPVQWWGALNQQFQSLASQTARDWQQHAQRAQQHLAAAQAHASTPTETAKPAPQPTAKAAARARPATKTSPKS